MSAALDHQSCVRINWRCRYYPYCARSDCGYRNRDWERSAGTVELRILPFEQLYEVQILHVETAAGGAVPLIVKVPCAARLAEGIAMALAAGPAAMQFFAVEGIALHHPSAIAV